RVFGDGGWRSANSDRGDSRGIYLAAGAAAGGYTFPPTRRFCALWSGSDAAAGRSHRRPAVENWFGCNDENLRRIASFTEFARLSDSSCTRLFGTEAFIVPSVCPSMTMRAAPYCPASFPISSTTKPTFGSYSSSTSFPSVERVTFLFRSHEFGKKWITTVFVRISSFSPCTVPALAGANGMPYSFFCLAYCSAAPSFW